MHDRDLDQIQSDLDMQVINQWLIEDQLRNMCGGGPGPRGPKSDWSPLWKLVRLAMFIVCALFFLSKLESCCGVFFSR
jgi:hypothetical protein